MTLLLFHVISILVIMVAYVMFAPLFTVTNNSARTGANTLIAVVQYYFFFQLPAFTYCFHCRVTSYHFIHSPLLTHFTSNSVMHLILELVLVCFS